MFAQQQMNELAERRKLLLLEADLHRSVIGLERARLRARLASLNKARERVSAGGPWLVVGGAVAGLLAVRNWRKFVSWIPAALTALRWAQLPRGR